MSAAPSASASSTCSLTFSQNLADVCATRKITGRKRLDEAFMEGLLRDEKYVEVLRHLWDEPSQVKRMVWLKDHYNFRVLHAPLFFELAYEKFNWDPCQHSQKEALSTLIEISLPLINQGRVLTDAAALSIVQTQEEFNHNPPHKLGERLSGIYLGYLNVSVKVILNKELSDIQKIYNREITKSNANAYRRIAASLILNPLPLPSPTWAGAYRNESLSVAHVERVNATIEIRALKTLSAEMLKYAQKLEESLSPQENNG